MPRKVRVLARWALAASLAVSTGLACAAPSRVFVAASGHDTGVCSLTFPCRTFAAAIRVVADSGEIVALDSGEYGIVDITKSLTITAAPGAYAGISAPNGTNGISINAPGGTVRIRGIAMDSQQPWTAPNTTAPVTTGIAINILAAANVSIENCVITHFPYMGVQALPAPASTQTTPLTINIVDSVFTESGQYAAVYLQPGNFASGATVTANLHNVNMNGYNNYASTGNEGLLIGDGVSATIDNCQIVNYYYGMIVYALSKHAYAVATDNIWNNAYVDVAAYPGGAGTVVADLRGNVLTGTSAAAPSVFGSDPTTAASIQTFGDGANVSLYGNTISNNSIGVLQGAGVVSSFGNNQFISNGTDVAGSLTSASTK